MRRTLIKMHPNSNRLQWYTNQILTPPSNTWVLHTNIHAGDVLRILMHYILCIWIKKIICIHVCIGCVLHCIYYENRNQFNWIPSSVLCDMIGYVTIVSSMVYSNSISRIAWCNKMLCFFLNFCSNEPNLYDTTSITTEHSLAKVIGFSFDHKL